MTRQRIPRAENDLYPRHSQRIVRALQVGELDLYAYAVLSFLVDVIELPGRNGEAIYTLGGLTEAVGWPLGPESLRQKLHELRGQGWIEFDDPRRGPGSAWVFRLSGAAVDAERTEFPMSFQAEGPSPLETSSNRRPTTKAARPQHNSVTGHGEFPTAHFPREEQSRDEIFTEERDDHVLGKTTVATLERERAFLADCQALVDAGLARWRENSEGSVQQ